MRPCVGEDVDFPAWTGSEGRPRSPKRPPTLLEDASDGRAWDFFFGLFIPEACYACATSGTPSDGVLLLRHDAIQNLMLVLLVSYRTLAANNRPGASAGSATASLPPAQRHYVAFIEDPLTRSCSGAPTLWLAPSSQCSIWQQRCFYAQPSLSANDAHIRSQIDPILPRRRSMGRISCSRKQEFGPVGRRPHYPILFPT